MGGELIQSAPVDGNVVLLVQEPARGSQGAAKVGAPLRATAGRAAYEGAGDWLHLMINPRVESAGLQLTSDRVDVSQGSGDAFARGNVKATWAGGSGAAARPGGGTQPGFALGGRGAGHRGRGDAAPVRGR